MDLPLSVNLKKFSITIVVENFFKFTIYDGQFTMNEIFHLGKIN